MPTIKVLPEHLANKIAAGEVIERPASIVKELVENSLDAGAKTVEVTIQHGGKSLIRVADDGCGMSAADAELSFQRHATSKISSADDLFSIASYGFRGEALPSIAAVSRVKLLTRTANEKTGTELVIEGGKIHSIKEAPCKTGSILEVRDLFFNTPARRKFLKGDSTEEGHVYDTVCNLALSRPNVRFIYKEGEKVIFDFLPGQPLKERAAAVWGPETSKYLIDFKTEKSGVKIYGVLSKPYAAKANRTGQIFFINQRWIKSISLSYGLQAGYHGLLMHGQYPLAVLFFDLDVTKVDVNVHPTKQEVRLSNEAEIKNLLKEAVAEALAATPDLAPLMKNRESVLPPPSFTARPADFLTKKPVIYSSLDQEESPAAAEQTIPLYVPAPVEKELIEAISLRDKLKITKILGQIHHTFIVAETDEGMMLIDQHAAHERVMFEALVKNFNESVPVSQRLLMEEVVEFHPRQMELLKEALPLLRKTGFEIDEFGKNTYVIRAVPAMFEKENAPAVLRTFLEEKEMGKSRTSLDNFQEDIAAMIACKRKSVRAFDPLTPVQLQALLERLALCDNPFSCPHGRPTLMKHSFSDLERQFKRKL